MYLYLKWAHLVSIISWMAGILYLFRLFIYHVERGQSNIEIHDLFSLMEMRLYKYITVPAMISSWVFGLWMIMLNPGLFQGKWLHTKLLLVIILTGSTFYAGMIRKRFDKKSFSFSSKQLRFLNEVPTLLMIGIVGLVVMKWF